MKFISVCSGIEAASVAFHPLGWSAVAFSEIEPFPSAVLAHHYPGVPNFGDMNDYPWWPDEVFLEADAVVGGPPCQAFSVAGLRAGLHDDRGNLTLTYAELINHADGVRTRAGKPPVVVLYENVPGLLSDKTNAFGCLLAGLAGEDEPLVPTGKRWPNAGYVLGPQRAVAWRILDAQYFGLAQRRRRVFVVASARDGFDPATVLFEWEGVRRDSAPRRGEGSGVAVGTLGGTSPGGGWRFGADEGAAGQLIPVAYGGNNTAGPIDVATARNACASASGRMDFETETFLVQPARPVGFNARQDPDHWYDRTGPLDTDGGTQAVAFAENSRAEVRLEGGDGSRCGAISTGGGKPGQGVPMIAHTMQVRRLTPRECERLQGFPDDYTRIPWKLGYWPADKHSADVRDAIAEQCPDGPRYKALGNSWAVPVVRWIGSRISAHIKGELTSPDEAFL